MIALACSGLLVIMVALPFVAVGYSMFRLYAVAITVLSVFFVIGGIILSKNLSFKKKTLPKVQKQEGNALQVRAYLIILLVLIGYFFCVTGVTYQVFGYPRQITLNSEGAQYNLLYVHDGESYAAKWLKGYATKRQKVYAADFLGGRRLTSQGMIPPSAINTISFIKHEKIDGYIYLRHYNIVNGELMDYYNEIYNMTDYQDLYTKKSGIYDSGCSKIYC